MMSHIECRTIRPEDEQFLYRVYASTRDDILAVIDWTDEQKAALIWQQFSTQHRYYQEHFPNAAYDVILADGEPVGRLYVDRREDQIRVIDIALLKEARGRGIGSSLMASIIDEARAAGIPVRIHVEQRNQALHLYYRLGFTEIEEQGIYYLMEWVPDEDSRSLLVRVR